MARQGKSIEDNAIQCNTALDNTRQSKTIQNSAVQVTMRQDKTRQSMIIQCKTIQSNINNIRQCKTIHNHTTQYTIMQGKTLSYNSKLYYRAMLGKFDQDKTYNIREEHLRQYNTISDKARS